MPIKTQCRKCRREYTVKDELAGKKFRCKDCEAVVTVPQPAVLLEDEPDPEEETFGDDFGSFDNFDDEYGAESYATPARPQKSKKRTAKKKRGKKGPSAAGAILTKVGTLFGAAIGFLFVVGLIFKVINAAGGLGALDLGASWKPYTTPDGHVTVLMPGDAKTVPVAQMSPGGQSFGVSRNSFGCVIVIEPMPAEMQGLSEEEIFSAFEFGSGFVGATNVARSTVNGRNCLRFDRRSPVGINSSNLAFVYKNKFYTLNYAYKTVKGSGESKYFESVQFN